MLNAVLSALDVFLLVLKQMGQKRWKLCRRKHLNSKAVQNTSTEENQAEFLCVGPDKGRQAQVAFSAGVIFEGGRCRKSLLDGAFRDMIKVVQDKVVLHLGASKKVLQASNISSDSP